MRARNRTRLATLSLGLLAACAAERGGERRYVGPTAPRAGVRDERQEPQDRGEAPAEAEGDAYDEGDADEAAAAEAPAAQEGQEVPAETGPVLPDSAPRYETGGTAPPAPAPEDPEPFAVGGVPIRGWLSSSFRYRATSDTQDADLYATLSLDVADPEKDAVTGHLLVYGNGDLDGQPSNATEDAVFFDVNNTYDSDFVGRLYDAYIDVHAVEFLDEARLGRQLNYDTPVPAWFDGLWLESAEATEKRAQIGAYAGAPVRLFESSEGVMGGVYAQARPWDGGRLRLDYMHLVDGIEDSDSEKDLYGIRGWQAVGPSLSLTSGYTQLQSDPRDWFVRGEWFEAKSDLRLTAAFYELLRTQRDLPLDIDPFYSTLFDLFPYQQAVFQAAKGLGEHVRLEAGAALRRVTDEDDEGENNRDFDRYYLTTSFLALPGELDLSLTGELYDASGTDTSSWGADLSRRFGSRWDATLGSYFALFEFNQALDEERENVRTYFLRTRFAKSDKLSFELRADYQDDELDDYVVLRLGTTWSF